MKHSVLFCDGHHMTSSIAIIIVSSIMVIAAVCALIWATRAGCFKDLQKVAVDILDDNR